QEWMVEVQRRAVVNRPAGTKQDDRLPPHPTQEWLDIGCLDARARRHTAHINDDTGPGEQPQVDSIDSCTAVEKVIRGITVRSALRSHRDSEQVESFAGDRCGATKANRRI